MLPFSFWPFFFLFLVIFRAYYLRAAPTCPSLNLQFELLLSEAVVASLSLLLSSLNKLLVRTSENFIQSLEFRRAFIFERMFLIEGEKIQLEEPLRQSKALDSSSTKLVSSETN